MRFDSFGLLNNKNTLCQCDRFSQSPLVNRLVFMQKILDQSKIQNRTRSIATLNLIFCFSATSQCIVRAVLEFTLALFGRLYMISLLRSCTSCISTSFECDSLRSMFYSSRSRRTHAYHILCCKHDTATTAKYKKHAKRNHNCTHNQKREISRVCER
jgi:hypothetical protein